MLPLPLEMQQAMKGLSFIDLFAGLGGFHLALESMGAKPVFASEWDKFSKATYSANFGIEPKGDITKIKAEDIPAHDIICAGFPCQAFSISGKQKGFADTRGTLFFDVARIAKHHKPKFLFLENVKNLHSHDGGKTFQVIENTLQELGYVVGWHVLNASHFGLAQQRWRVIIWASRKDLYPKPLDFTNIHDALPTKHICLQDVLLPLEETKQYKIDRNDIKMIPQELRPTEPANKPMRIGTINKGGQGERIYSTLGTSITLSANGGGAAAKTGAYLQEGVVRKLHPRECARLQGFPEDYKLMHSDSQIWKQMGNSVPINLLQAVLATAYKQGFFKIQKNDKVQETMLNGSKIAKSGNSSEKRIRDLLVQNPSLVYDLAKIVCPNAYSDSFAAHHVGSAGKKADVYLEFDKEGFGISVKQTGTVNFNQALRGKYDSFAANLGIDSGFEKTLMQALKQRPLSKKLFDKVRDKELVNFCHEHRQSIVENALFGSKGQNVQFLAVLDTLHNKIFFIPRTTLLQYFDQQQFHVSETGNLMLGKGFGIYRKGGDGHYKKLPKSDFHHPGNDLQVKIKPRTILDELLLQFPNQVLVWKL